MGFIPPLNLGNFQPSPATLSQWIYQIWQYLQENPIATQEQLQEYISSFITTSPEVQEMIGVGVDNYLVDNPPSAPVQSVQGKTGAVVLAYKDIVAAGNNVPVYRYVGAAESMPTTATLQGQYSIGYRLWVHVANRDLYTLKADGTYELIGQGNLSGANLLYGDGSDDTIREVVSAVSDTASGAATAASNLTQSATYHIGDVITDNSVKLGYCQTGGDNYPNNSQVVFNVNLPKEIDSDVSNITFTSGTSMVIRCGGARLPDRSSATIGQTTDWEYVSASVNKELGIVRITFNIPKNTTVEQQAATLAGTVKFTLA